MGQGENEHIFNGLRQIHSSNINPF